MFSFRIHPLFYLLILLFIFLGRIDEIIIAFISVIFHELIHIISAYKCGYGINKIELFPFGGMAEYRGLLEMNPVHEILIAISGPFLSLSLAGLFLLINRDIFMKYNLFLGIFNLVPALPLDGGRVFRGILVSKKGFKDGSKIAIKISRLMAAAGFLTGIIAFIMTKTNLWILLISIFVYSAVIKEEGQYIYGLLTYLTRRKKYIDKIKLKKVAVQVVEGNLYLKEVISSLLPDKFNIFYVLDKNSDIVGYVSEKKLLDYYFNIKKEDSKIIHIMKDI